MSFYFYALHAALLPDISLDRRGHARSRTDSLGRVSE